MKKFLLFQLILLSFNLFAKTNKFEFCIKSDSIYATKMHPQVRLDAFVNNKKDSLFLRIPVNCKNGKSLIPKSRREAISFLDIILPIDFKSALLKENSIRSVYLYSPYGSSIVYDFYQYLVREWKFDKKRTQICKECEEIRSIDCYFLLLEGLVKNYK